MLQSQTEPQHLQLADGKYFVHIKLPSVQLQRRFENLFANAANDDNVY